MGIGIEFRDLFIFVSSSLLWEKLFSLSVSCAALSAGRWYTRAFPVEDCLLILLTTFNLLSVYIHKFIIFLIEGKCTEELFLTVNKPS